MRSSSSFLSRFLRDRRGSAYVEYVVLVAVCALGAVAYTRSWTGSLHGAVSARISDLAASGSSSTGSSSTGTSPEPPARTTRPPASSVVPVPRGSTCTGRSCPSKGNCFAAGTLVYTADGDRPIEDVRVGDLVWSRDEGSGALALRPVLQTFETESAPVLALQLDDGARKEEIVVTPNHPFWVDQQGWIDASELADVRMLWSPSGALVGHLGAAWSARAKVYNFEVAELHTYFVGASHAWVHNAPQKPCDAPGPNAAPQSYLDYAKSLQNVSQTPASMKQKWEDDDFKYEVRVHPAEPQYGKTGSIYRVARRSKEVDEHGQGSGWEYLGDDGKWYKQSILKPGPNQDHDAAARTHIQVPP